MKLITDRLILRTPTMNDISDSVEGLSNLKVSKWLAKVPHPYNAKDAKWWINHCVENSKKKKKDKKDFAFNIELKSEHKVIGGCGLHGYDSFNESIEIGYWVNEKYWKQGIITEASSTVIDYAFEKLKVNRISLYAYGKNAGSNAVAKKLGFTYEGCLRKYHKALSTGNIHDANLYSMLKSEWAKNKKRLMKK